MNIHELKSEILTHLTEMSNLRTGEPIEFKTTWQPDADIVTTWSIYEDNNKSQNSTWIEKEADGSRLGTVILQGTKLSFKPGFKQLKSDSEQGCSNGIWNASENSDVMLLADLIAPDSFDEAIKKLKHALNVLNVCKPPKGMGIFGSMTPPGMTGFSR